MFPGVNECGWLCGMSINVYMIWASENVDSSVCACALVYLFQHVAVSALFVPVRLYVP